MNLAKTPKELVEFLKEIAREAGEIQLKFFRRGFSIRKKHMAGLVTEVDLLSERHLIKRILHSFPDSEIITEETGLISSGKNYRWILDPLDGTSNFAHGVPWFCVSIGLEIQGELKAGVVFHPCFQELFWAVKGKGAFLEKLGTRRRISVSQTTQLENSMLGTGFYYFRGRELQQEVKRFGWVSEKVQSVRRSGAAALDLAYVALGSFDGFWEKGLSVWDVAAGFVIVEEAGGKISDYSGKSISWRDSREIIASNGRIHRALSQVLLGPKR